jgi:hypothetical protein
MSLKNFKANKNRYYIQELYEFKINAHKKQA